MISHMNEQALYDTNDERQHIVVDSSLSDWTHLQQTLTNALSNILPQKTSAKLSLHTHTRDSLDGYLRSIQQRKRTRRRSSEDSNESRAQKMIKYTNSNGIITSSQVDVSTEDSGVMNGLEEALKPCVDSTNRKILTPKRPQRGEGGNNNNNNNYNSIESIVSSSPTAETMDLAQAEKAISELSLLLKTLHLSTDLKERIYTWIILLNSSLFEQSVSAINFNFGDLSNLIYKNRSVGNVDQLKQAFELLQESMELIEVDNIEATARLIKVPSWNLFIPNLLTCLTAFFTFNKISESGGKAKFLEHLETFISALESVKTLISLHSHISQNTRICSPELSQASSRAILEEGLNILEFVSGLTRSLTMIENSGFDFDESIWLLLSRKFVDVACEFAKQMEKFL